MNASDYRLRARQALAGNWPMAVLVGLVASILGGGNGVNFNWNVEKNMESVERISPELAMLLLGLIGIIGVFAFAYGVVMLVVGSVVHLGYVRYNLKLVDGHMAHMGDLFAYFGRFWDAFLLRLLMGVLIVAWSLLFVIPGIVAGYSYAMAPYIMAEDPNCTAMEAIRRSKAMMNGHKMDLFLLELSFIGWAILSAFTLGLGNLLLTPYTAAATAAFYRDLQSRPRYQQYEPYNEM